jgi:CobD/Cbib protein
VAPLIWGALAGPAGVSGYRAVNTMDAVAGHHSPRYERIGKASARFDDMANWVRARVTAGAAPACCNSGRAVTSSELAGDAGHREATSPISRLSGRSSRHLPALGSQPAATTNTDRHHRPARSPLLQLTRRTRPGRRALAGCRMPASASTPSTRRGPGRTTMPSASIPPTGMPGNRPATV